MKLFPGVQTRQEYIKTQIVRSETKFHYCKVSTHDVVKYRKVIFEDMTGRGETPDVGPILCLGTRSGREVDLFRTQFYGAKMSKFGTNVFERHSHSFASAFPILESNGRSDVGKISRASVVGVEINPRAVRSDIWTGSFDEMPSDWEDRFGLVYSNSFDQSQNPYSTAAEWKRVIRPGGYLVCCYSDGAEPTDSDPVGDMSLDDVVSLFGGQLVYFHQKGSRNNYSEAIIRLDNAS